MGKEWRTLKLVFSFFRCFSHQALTVKLLSGVILIKLQGRVHVAFLVYIYVVVLSWLQFMIFMIYSRIFHKSVEAMNVRIAAILGLCGNYFYY